MAKKSKRAQRKRQIKRVVAKKSKRTQNKKQIKTDKPTPIHFFDTKHLNHDSYFLKNEVLAIIDEDVARRLILQGFTRLVPESMGGISEPAQSIRDKITASPNSPAGWFKYQAHQPTPRLAFMRKDAEPVKCHARKERALLVGTRSANHIRAGGHSGCTQRPDTWLHPNASRKRQIPLASRAPSIHGTCATCHDEVFRSALKAKADLQTSCAPKLMRSGRVSPQPSPFSNPASRFRSQFVVLGSGATLPSAGQEAVPQPKRPVMEWRKNAHR